MPLYHKEIGFPRKMKFKAVEGLIPSMHAQREAASDRYGNLPMPSAFDPLTWEVIEIEVLNGSLHKVVARKPFDAERSIVMVFNPRDKAIRTVWCNLNSDNHRTLDKSAYATP